MIENIYHIISFFKKANNSNNKKLNIKTQILKYKNWYTRKTEILNADAPNNKHLKNIENKN